MFPGMSRAGTSIFLFGIYLVILGLIFSLVTNTLLSIINLPDSQEVWIRLVGMLLLIMAFYYNGSLLPLGRSYRHPQFLSLDFINSPGFGLFPGRVCHGWLDFTHRVHLLAR
jgi:hypothetical protein